MAVPQNVLNAILNPIAVSLAAADTSACLEELERLAPKIGMAEIRVDLMREFDLEKLVTDSPVPLIVTCRPIRERGAYTGPEDERLAILRAAYESGCAYIDIEADSLDAISGWQGSATRFIASQHWYDHMPPDFSGIYRDLRDRCDVVKLAGMARSAADVVPLFAFLRDATSPVVGMAMGDHGVCTRILAPTFRHSLLTYGSASEAASTAPGQVTVDELADVHHLRSAGAHTRVCVHVVSTESQYRAVLAAQKQVQDGGELHVGLRAAATDDPVALAHALREAIPHAEIHIAK
jgi:3-dehydroquinate dehydratase type I